MRSGGKRDVGSGTRPVQTQLLKKKKKFSETEEYLLHIYLSRILVVHFIAYRLSCKTPDCGNVCMGTGESIRYTKIAVTDALRV